jgi:SAM-dependent methyltransferase
MRYVNGIAAAAFGALGASAAEGRRLRVLEVGAGTGGTTAALLPRLPSERTHYVFSDVSDLFLDRARERFAAYGFIDYRRFDMEQEPAAQGFEAGSFDVIVSANAVHASTDLRKALQRLRSLLAPGGTLVLVESTVHLDWFDMTTGLIEGWQHFADDLRTDNPLLAPETWVRAFSRESRVRSPVRRRHPQRTRTNASPKRGRLPLLPPPQEERRSASVCSRLCRQTGSISCVTSCATRWSVC